MDNSAAIGGSQLASVEPTIASEAASMTVLEVSFIVLFRLGVVRFNLCDMVFPRCRVVQ